MKLHNLKKKNYNYLHFDKNTSNFNFSLLHEINLNSLHEINYVRLISLEYLLHEIVRLIT